jgi:hypothetical protein
MLPASCLNKLLPQIGDKVIDDRELRFVRSAIQVIEEHLLGYYGALAQTE